MTRRDLLKTLLATPLAGVAATPALKRPEMRPGGPHPNATAGYVVRDNDGRDPYAYLMSPGANLRRALKVSRDYDAMRTLNGDRQDPLG